MSRRSSRLISMGHYNDEGEPIISYKETLHRVFTRRRYRHGFYPVGEDTIIIDNGKNTGNGISDNRFINRNTGNGISDNRFINRNTGNGISDNKFINRNTGNGISDNKFINKSTSKSIRDNKIINKSTRKSIGDNKIFNKSTRKSIRNNKIINNSNSSSSRVRIIFYFFLMLSLCFGCISLINTLDPTFLSESPETPIYMSMDSIEDREEIEFELGKLQERLTDLRRKVDTLVPLADALSNFALESQGASVLFHLSSKTYLAEKPYLTFFGIPIWRPSISPRIVIQGDSNLIPGRCWAFAGEQGHLFIALSEPVTISHVSLGHICKDRSPTGSISSAPKEFSVHGLETLDDDGTELGTFLYDQDGDQLQTFKLLNHKIGAYKFVRLEVQSNWGHPEYSCVYSFRVHGKAPG